MRRAIVIIIITVCSYYGCTEDGCPVCSDEPSVVELEYMVRQNCQIVLDAIERFALDNDGGYPLSIYSDSTLSGKTLIDLLPGGTLLNNPFTGEPTEPTDGIASKPGETGYWRYSWCAYGITGFGQDSLITELSNVEALEDSVRINCLVVQVAAEAFAAQNNGEYPTNVHSDRNLAGNRLVDLLPGGMCLKNPFTGAYTEPTDCHAAVEGSTGYVCCAPTPDSICGYKITGCGKNADIIVITSVGCCN